jgi:protein-L-isoaspartate(D-aspartate) O-methyltransferase
MMKILLVWVVLFYIQILSNCGGGNNHEFTKNNANQKNKYEQRRMKMVNEQIIARNIHDKKVIEAMKKVPRHEFVPADYVNSAYKDSPLPIGHGQTISQPYIVAYMTEQLDLSEKDTVLEIGTGSGYQAAVLAEIVSHVYTIEIVPELASMANEVLKNLGYENVSVKMGDGYKGWQEYAPYDAIMLTAAPLRIPQPLLNQLEDNGRLIAPIGDEFQELVLVTRNGENFSRKKLIPVRFVPMTGEIQKK